MIRSTLALAATLAALAGSAGAAPPPPDPRCKGHCATILAGMSHPLWPACEWTQTPSGTPICKPITCRQLAIGVYCVYDN
jgi:hypothetical protein